MNICFSLEGDLIRASGLDLDLIPIRYDLLGLGGQNISGLNASVYIDGMNAYTRHFYNFIDQEMPGIQIHKNILSDFNKEDKINQDASGRKWGALHLLAIIFKKAIFEVESKLTTNIEDIGVVSSPALFMQNRRDIELALDINNKGLMHLISYGQASLLYNIEDGEITTEDDHALFVFLDHTEINIELFEKCADGYNLYIESIKSNKLHEATKLIQQKINTLLEGRIRFTQKSKNNIRLEAIKCLKNFMINESLQVYNNDILLEDEIFNICISEEIVSESIGDFSNAIKMALDTMFLKTGIDKDGLNKIFLSGAYHHFKQFKGGVENYSGTWEDKLITDTKNMWLSKGGALALSSQFLNFKVHFKEGKNQEEPGKLSLVSLEMPDEVIEINLNSFTGDNLKTLIQRDEEYAIQTNTFKIIKTVDDEKEELGFIEISTFEDFKLIEYEINLVIKNNKILAVQALDQFNENILNSKFYLEDPSFDPVPKSSKIAINKSNKVQVKLGNGERKINISPKNDAIKVGSKPKLNIKIGQAVSEQNKIKVGEKGKQKEKQIVPSTSSKININYIRAKAKDTEEVIEIKDFKSLIRNMAINNA